MTNHLDTKRKLESEFTGMQDYDPNALAVNVAKRFILEAIDPVKEIEQVKILRSLGRTVAKDVNSPVDVPPFDNSAMDGYAIKASNQMPEGKTELEIVGKAFAGKPFKGKMSDNQTVRIMTGAVIPDNADTVVMQERTRTVDRTLVMETKIPKGANTRKCGEDLKKGEVALASGKLIMPSDMGLLASLGVESVNVRRRVKVAIFSTGDELISIGQIPKPGQIFDSNRYSLNGLLERLGCEIIDMGIIEDNKKSLNQALLKAGDQADLIITTGGVSVGDADYIKEVLDELGEVLFWKISMKPGRPLAFGKIKGSYFFGLPGNPVSVMVTFYQLVRDAIKRLQGEKSKQQTITHKVKCRGTIRKVPGRTEFQRGVVFQQNGELVVSTTGNQGSGILSSMSQANCFIILQPQEQTINDGEMVEVQFFDGIV